MSLHSYVALAVDLPGLALHAELHKTGQAAALAYARAHFGPFRASFLKDIQRLMGCLVFSGRSGLEGCGSSAPSPYADLLHPERWEEVAQQFTRLACGLMGQVRLAAFIPMLYALFLQGNVDRHIP